MMFNRKLSYRIPVELVLICLIPLITFPAKKAFGADEKADASRCSALVELAVRDFAVETEIISFFILSILIVFILLIPYSLLIVS